MLKLRKTLISSIFGALCLAHGAAAQDDDKPRIKVIDPDKKVPAANAAALDTESFEIGLFAGFLSVEEFNTNPSFGFALRYYLSEKFLVEGAIGTSDTARAIGEEDRDFNPDRTFSYFSVSAGYQFLKGRSFWGKKRKYNTGLYALAGIENVDFAETTETGLVLAVSYKTVLTDSFTINFDLKNHIVNRDFNNESGTTMNPEFVIGLNTIF